MSNRILVVDDEDPILFAMKEYFMTQGYGVDCAREFEEAEALLANVCYSVVIADLRLTGINGVEGLELVVSVRQRSPQTRIIILTAYGSPETEKEALRRGVDAFLRKPIPLPQLAQILVAFKESRIR
jgi:DNA-binding NtrC family response regulator